MSHAPLTGHVRSELAVQATGRTLPGVMTRRRARGRRPVWALLATGAACLTNGAAHAQISTLIAPAYDPDFNRDRNQSVRERPHPNYDPLGVRVGSMVANVAMSAITEYSDNVYTDNSNKVGDVALVLTPIASLASDWSNHSLRLTASGDLRRYATQTLKNQNAWLVDARSRVDIMRDIQFFLDGQVERAVESPFSDDLVANLTTPSRYIHTAIAPAVIYEGGRSRITVKGDRNQYKFSDVRFADGSFRDQQSRDRVTYRGFVIYEFALSPSLSLYGQALADRQEYRAPLNNGRPNRDSTGWMLVAGANFDLAGVARGSIGAGYSRRNFTASQFYRPASGLSVQAQVEFFLSPITTIGLTAQRQLQDNSIGDGAAQWDSRMRLTVDHELLRNMIVSANIEAGRRSYINFDSQTDFVDAGVSAQYQATRGLGFRMAVNYGSSTPRGIELSRPFDVFRISGGVTVRI